jgi:hypothetical protein
MEFPLTDLLNRERCTQLLLEHFQALGLALCPSVVTRGQQLLSDCARLCEECLDRFHVSLLVQHRIDEIPVSVNSSIKVAPLTFDPNICFVYVPGRTHFPLALGT